ncbi:MAG: thiamine pyrophosphate-dependent enzyme [Bacillota bacterium]|jgi:pyruvate ferredoxin oxidoreductase beta subunit
MATLKELTRKPELLTGGHRLCAGCGASIVVRQLLKAADTPLVLANATGCLEVATTIYPYTAWRASWMHSAFENAAATISGIEAAYKSLKRQGKIQEDIKFVAFAGDGGTYDIGFQALSGAAERGHKMVYVCYDNGAYMNTGIQRSSSTPLGADTTTSPAGSKVPGKTMHRKDLSAIMAAHNIPYVAQVSPSHWSDAVKKMEKALAADGPAFINALAPCPRGWRTQTSETIDLCRLAVDTCYWPLYEVEDGVWRLTQKPKEKKPLEEWLKRQGRFRHLFKGNNKAILDELQGWVDRNWESLLKRCETG